MHWAKTNNTPFPSFPGPLYQNEVKCSGFDVEMIFHSRANKTHFHNKGCVLTLILKERVFGIRKWSILLMFFVRGFVPVRLLFSSCIAVLYLAKGLFFFK